MALPTIEHPTYELTLRSNNQTVKYRPFLVKEEKVILLALEDGTYAAMLNAVKDICKACTNNQVDIDTLPLFDIEYLFLNIRAKSVGEISKIRVLCPDDKTTYANVEVDLTKVDILVDENHEKDILIDKNKNLGIMMKYITMPDVMTIDNLEATTSKELFDIIARGIDYVYEGDRIYKSSDYTPEEMRDFLENLTTDTLTRIKAFYDTSPKLKHTVEVENPNTKVKSEITLQGLYDFFE